MDAPYVMYEALHPCRLAKPSPKYARDLQSSIFGISFLINLINGIVDSSALLRPDFSATILRNFKLLRLSRCSAQEILRCWRCSTDVSNGEFCNDPFNPNSISDQQRYWSYVNCTYSAGVKSVNARPVCKKLVQEVEVDLNFYLQTYTICWTRLSITISQCFLEITSLCVRCLIGSSGLRLHSSLICF
uniref:Protein quiver n=1 Tax=Glossina pallidipes TaxID=7398 RepID=A0A1A9ZFI6_GLOPL